MRSYLVRLGWSDAVVVAFAVCLAQLVRFGAGSATAPNGAIAAPAILVSALLGAAWILALRGFHTLDRRIVGGGSQEYSRVVSACLCVFGGLAILDLLFRLNIARGFLALALPVGTAGLLLTRWAWRQYLTSKRVAGKHVERVLVVGDPKSAEPVIKRLIQDPGLGYRVVGICVPKRNADGGSLQVEDQSVGVLGSLSDVCRSVVESNATTVAVTSAEDIGHSAMQRLSWDLEELSVDMVVSPGVLDIAGPRILVRPVAGLPLLHIDKPRYEGANRLRKAMVDRIGSATLLILLAPIFMTVAIAIKLDSSGPVFYRSTRVGLNNMPFKMWKFRSMTDGADDLKDSLRGYNEVIGGVLFKIRDDPRVTRVGAVIRRYSLDELPQLFNVLLGTMSLVGPRPPLPEEVERYDGHVARRMLVKPGITGLWQVSGRSDLSWEEAIRLDLSYVENWSIIQDAQILIKTFVTVVRKDGAY
ncbi:sugar transferase [Gordonia jinghuaiqii]|uniref:sugar transferase n=1 Tax=Gordonia jinghuaiqii TaxID=2758710 RepID=UPI002948BFC4|nr:sugar transferase [Gordonia jinghuaiqii]